MQRREALLAGGTIAAAALAGCIGGATDPDDGGNPGSSDRTISVSGAGEVTADPDIAEFSVSVEGRAATIDAVRDDLASRIETVRSALLEAGLEEDDVVTERFRIRQIVESRERVSDERSEEPADDSPEPDEERTERVIHVGTHSLSVTVREVDDIGKFIDIAIDAGADEIGRVTFTLSDEERGAVRNEALELAIDGALAEADHIAAQLDATVLETKHVNAAGSQVSPYRAELAAMDDVDDGTRIHPDDVTVRASVDVVVRIEANAS